MTTALTSAWPRDLAAAEWIKLRSLRSTYLWIAVAFSATGIPLALLLKKTLHKDVQAGQEEQEPSPDLLSATGSVPAHQRPAFPQ